MRILYGPYISINFGGADFVSFNAYVIGVKTALYKL
jgi:hypothetical protein